MGLQNIKLYYHAFTLVLNRDPGGLFFYLWFGLMCTTDSLANPKPKNLKKFRISL